MVYKKEELHPINLEIRNVIQCDPGFGLINLILVKKQNGKNFPEKFTLQDLILNFEPTDKRDHFSDEKIKDCFEEMYRLRIIKKCEDEDKYFLNKKFQFTVGEDINGKNYIFCREVANETYVNE